MKINRTWKYFNRICPPGRAPEDEFFAPGVKNDEETAVITYYIDVSVSPAESLVNIPNLRKFYGGYSVEFYLSQTNQQQVEENFEQLLHRVQQSLEANSVSNPWVEEFMAQAPAQPEKLIP